MAKQHRLHKLVQKREHIAYEMDIASSLKEYLNQCWYNGDHNHLHDKGICSSCDWRRQARDAAGWWDSSFVESWDWEEFIATNNRGYVLLEEDRFLSYPFYL